MKWTYIFIICMLLSCSSDNKQKLYEEKMDKLQELLSVWRYNDLIDYFKETYGRFPDSLNEVYLAYKQSYPEDIEIIELRHFMDIFNKKGRWIGYFPIYNSDDSEIISYIILSAGIDGKLDNVFDSSDKLHLDDWKQKLHLYNPDEFDDGTNKVCVEERPYSAREEKSGNKDLLLYVHHLFNTRMKLK